MGIARRAENPLTRREKIRRLPRAVASATLHTTALLVNQAIVHLGAGPQVELQRGEQKLKGRLSFYADHPVVCHSGTMTFPREGDILETPDEIIVVTNQGAPRFPKRPRSR